MANKQTAPVSELKNCYLSKRRLLLFSSIVLCAFILAPPRSFSARQLFDNHREGEKSFLWGHL